MLPHIHDEPTTTGVAQLLEQMFHISYDTVIFAKTGELIIDQCHGAAFELVGTPSLDACVARYDKNGKRRYYDKKP